MNDLSSRRHPLFQNSVATPADGQASAARACCGLAILDATASGSIGFATQKARMLLAKYFGAESDHRLPRVLLRWLQGYSIGRSLRTAPWITEIGEQQLSVRITGREEGCFQLLLEEKTMTSSPNRLETLGLTPREAEVLHWVMRGKTNSDIATILNCETATVMKHAERIFSKLHVETRTAAAAMAFEVMI